MPFLPLRHAQHPLTPVGRRRSPTLQRNKRVPA
jgi:hypothetical protein